MSDKGRGRMVGKSENVLKDWNEEIGHGCLLFLKVWRFYTLGPIL